MNSNRLYSGALALDSGYALALHGVAPAHPIIHKSGTRKTVKARFWPIWRR